MQPRRVISLCPSITETLVAIGGLRRLVAATRFCVRPEGLLWGLPRIGGTKNPDIPRILDLAPDLVFANEEENRREDVEALRAAGIEVNVSFPRKVDEVPGAIREWGRKLGEESEGEFLACRIEDALAALRDEPAGGSFRYAYWIWRNPWMTVSGTRTSPISSRSPAESTFSPGKQAAIRSPRRRWRLPAARVHFFPTEPFPFREEKHGKEVESRFGSAPRRLFVAGDDLCWHGVRTLDGLKAVRRLRAYREGR